MTEKPRSETGYEQLADQREREADELGQRSDELQSAVSDARDDWARKRADEGVPGAPAPDGESEAGSEGESEAGSDTDAAAAKHDQPDGETEPGGEPPD
jgi:hypothetical protein